MANLSDQSSSSEDEAQIQRKKERLQRQREELEEKLENNIELFIDLRFQHTNIHPSKDPAIIFLCRLFKHFLAREEHKMYYNRVFDTLRNKHEVNKQCLTPLKGVFNSIQKHSPCASFAYAKTKPKSKSKDSKPKDRWFIIKPIKDATAQEYSYALRCIRRVRELIKYGAWQYKAEDEEEEEEEEEKEWKWIGNSTFNKKDGVFDYEAITNGVNVFRINDVVLTRSKSIAMRPWVGRITQLYEGEEMRVTLRWFWFFNQIANDDGWTEDDIDTLFDRAKLYYETMTPCDIFESISDDESMTAENAVHVMLHPVFIAHSNSQYSDRINVDNVFRCDYNYDRKRMQFVKRTEGEMKGDEARLCEEMRNKAKGNKDNNDNSNNMEVDDGDLDVSDIKMNDRGFTIRDANTSNKNKEENADEDADVDVDVLDKKKKVNYKSDLSESETEIESDNSLDPNSI